jgi:hypothetical protein
MLKRTLVGLAFMIGATALNTSPASAFGWCLWGDGARSSPMTYSYAPRARTYYRPTRLYRPAHYGRAYYHPGFRVYRGAYYRPLVHRAYYRPGVRGLTRTYYRTAGARRFYGARARYRGRLP